MSYFNNLISNSRYINNPIKWKYLPLQEFPKAKVGEKNENDNKL